MTVSDSETENAGDILPEDARKDDVIPTDEAMIEGAKVTAANSSDMEITCVDQKISSNGDPGKIMLMVSVIVYRIFSVQRPFRY